MYKIEPSEAEVSRSIVQYLTMSNVFWWRQNTGMAVYQDKYKGERRVSYGTKGSSDFGCIAGGNRSKGIPGTYVAIETKTPKEHAFLVKHYDRIKAGRCKTKRDLHLFDQITFIEKVKAHGGEGFFVSSLYDLVEEFRKHGFIK